MEESKLEARAFVELITHVVEDGIFCFKFSSLRQMYQSRLDNLGISTRFALKNVLSQQNDGKNLILVFEQGMQQMLKSLECDYHAGESVDFEEGCQNCMCVMICFL